MFSTALAGTKRFFLALGYPFLAPAALAFGGHSAKRKRPGDEFRPLFCFLMEPPAAQGLRVTSRKLFKQKTVHLFLGALPYSVLTPNYETKSPLVRLAFMEKRNAKLANLLIGIFFIIMSGTLIVDLITFWPILRASSSIIAARSDE